MRLTIAPLAGIATTFALALCIAPAFAQEEGPSEKVNAVIVYGQDECPKPVGDEITICARKEEKERYRIPQGLRETPSATSESWNSRVMAYERVGKTGTMSCTPTGPGGWTGCSQKLIDAAYAEKKGASDVTFAKMIEAERTKRLSTIDADAAKSQAQVEQAEKDYEARQRAALDPQDAAAPATPPAPAGK